MAERDTVRVVSAGSRRLAVPRSDLVYRITPNVRAVTAFPVTCTPARANGGTVLST
jgi:hypothetical protein